MPIKTTLKEPNIDYRLVDERGPTVERLLKARESPINLAHSKGQITRFQYAAAQKFYLHWFKGGLCESYGNIDLTRVLGAPRSNFDGLAKTDLQAFHRKMLWHALELLKAEKSKILQDVILSEKSLVEVGYSIGYKDRDWSRAHVLRLLRQGLDLLCHEWGID